MANWREEATAVLKAALAKATEPKEIRDIASAISSLQPWESPGSTADKPMPVRIVGKSKAKKKGKRWTFPGKKASK